MNQLILNNFNYIIFLEFINSLHFADDTTIIASSIAALNALLQVVAEWADKYHLEIHPGKSTFYTNNPKNSELPVYKGVKIEPEKKKQLATVGICLDTDKRKSNNIDFRLQRFQQKTGMWATQLGRMHTLTPGEKIKIIKCTALPAILYGLEFTQTISRSKGHLKTITKAIAKACKIALRVGPKTANAKVLMEAGIKPIEIWIADRQMRQWKRYHKCGTSDPPNELVYEQLNAITEIKTQFYNDQTSNFTSRGLDVECNAKEFKDALRDDTRKYYHQLMTSSPTEKTTNAILNASKSLKDHPRLVLDSSKMPLYLKNGDVSLHPGVNVIARVRTGSYVDEAWMVERNLVVRRPNHTCTQCKRTTPGGVTFRHLALECPGTIDHRLSLL